MTNTVNKGKDSPKYAFMQRFTIPSRNRDADYLFRLRIIDTPWFGLYLHVIAGPDEDHHLHNHPAAFRAFILAGGYIENYLPQGDPPHCKLVREHKRFQWNLIPFGDFHRIVRVDAPAWTLVFRGRRRSDWGFLVEDEVIPMKEYLHPDKWGKWPQ